MLELINLQKRYGERTVLDRASLTVRRGDAVALVGANGSGKTTTLRCIVGLHHLNGGNIRIDGIDPSRAARARLSYLPQRADFPTTLSVHEILQVVATLRDLPHEAVDREISLCGLTHLASRTIAKLSGGERQRVALAMVLMPDVNLYLLDEPIASLDADGTRLLIDRICAIRDKGAAILFTTHVGADFDRLATRVALLHGGRIESVEETASSYLVVDMADSASPWVKTAMELRAHHAWATGRRLHVVTVLADAGAILAGLQEQGAVIETFRTDRSVSAALDRVHKEAGGAVAALADCADRNDVAVGLWRSRIWPGAATARSR